MKPVPGQRVLKSFLLALVAAAILLVTIVLPVEYGWDPLGSGKLLGVVGFAEVDRNPLQAQAAGWTNDRIEFQLQPFESVEYKYRMEEGAALLYAWQASAEVLFDMHSEPDGAAPGYAESFAKARSSREQGSYTAPFSGLHGWFWQNRGDQVVTVSVSVSGYFEEALEMNAGHVFRYEFQPAAAGAAAAGAAAADAAVDQP